MQLVLQSIRESRVFRPARLLLFCFRCSAIWPPRWDSGSVSAAWAAPASSRGAAAGLSGCCGAAPAADRKCAAWQPPKPSREESGQSAAAAASNGQRVWIAGAGVGRGDREKRRHAERTESRTRTARTQRYVDCRADGRCGNWRSWACVYCWADRDGWQSRRLLFWAQFGN